MDKQPMKFAFQPKFEVIVKWSPNSLIETKLLGTQKRLNTQEPQTNKSYQPWKCI